MTIGTLKKRVGAALIVLTLLIQSLFLVTPALAYTPNTLDTIVDNFTSDITFSKDASGIARAKVKEKIVVTFPSYNRSHGIDRELTFLINSGKTQILKTAESSFKVTRNGTDEPFTILKRSDNIVLETGSSSEYLHGVQEYEIEYELYNFISNPSVIYDETPYQDLSLNIFGADWSAGVKNAEINIHFTDDLKNSLRTVSSHSDAATHLAKSVAHSSNKTDSAVWCFIGSDESNQARCEIGETADGLSFKASDLAGNESLELVAAFTENAFTVSDEAYLGDAIYLPSLKSDYTLSKTDDGHSRLSVSKKFTAVFPENNSSRELTWNVPISSAENTRTILDYSSVRATLDGAEYSPKQIQRSEGYLSLVFDIENDTKNTHEYTIDYDLVDVTNQSASERALYQLETPEIEADELHLNLLSENWHYYVQDFSAEFHFEGDLKNSLTNIVSTSSLSSPLCYNPNKNSEFTCEISETEDGFSLAAYDIGLDSSLYFLADFKKDTFVAVSSEKSYLSVVLAAATVLFCALSLVASFLFKKLRRNQTPLYFIFTVVACVLIWLLFDAPSSVYQLFNMPFYSEHILSGLRYPCAILLIITCFVITLNGWKRFSKKPVESDPSAEPSKPHTATILIATHKKYRVSKEKCYLPIRVGAEKLDKNGKVVKKDTYGFTSDAKGENISRKNNSYCELTGLYWAWKNLDSDYIGLVHYRRYLSIHKPKLHQTPEERFRSILSSAELDSLINSDNPAENYDIILPKPRNYVIENLYNHYIHTSFRDPIDHTRDIIARKHPEYLAAFDNLKVRSSAHMFNMFIMRKDILDDYCEWLFDILFTLEQEFDELDISYNTYHRRFYGRISELLLDVYLYTKYPNLKQSLRVKELPVVNLEDTKWGERCKAFLLAKFTGKKYEKSF